jgi:tRNA pseudouridine13 synthase
MDSNQSTSSSSEYQVGIRQFLHPELVGISGIFKQRYSDFVVREITPENEVLYLKSLDGFQLEKDMFQPKVVEETKPCWTDSLEVVNGTVVAEKVISEFSLLFPDPSSIDKDEMDRFRSFLQLNYDKTTDAPNEFIGFPSNDKNLRSQMHQIIRNFAGSHFETGSVPGTENKFQFHIYPKSSGNAKNNNNANSNVPRRNNKRKFDEWPKHCPDYLHFTVMKENIDTMNCVHLLGKQMRINNTDIIKFNGTKDKRGITTQRISIYHSKPSYFQRINEYIFPPFVRCGNFQYSASPCSLGSLNGNRFELVIRKISSSLTQESVETIISTIVPDGFMNYFGLQRFGKGGCLTHHIGCFLLQGNYQQCIENIFLATNHDKDIVQEMKKLFREKNYQKALQIVENLHSFHSERSILQALNKNPTNYSGAFEKISKNIRLLYLHAYQSYLWNMIASERIGKYGLRLIEGDLVIENEKKGEKKMEIISTSEEVEEDKKEVEEQKPEMVTAEETIIEDEIELTQKKFSPTKIHIITAEDIQTNRYSMQDLVLPLVGYDVRLPQNEFGELYHQLLAKDGLTVETFKKCPTMYRLKGNYRKVIECVKDVEWELKEYSDENAELNQTELVGFINTSKEKREQKLAAKASKNENSNYYQAVDAEGNPLPILNETEEEEVNQEQEQEHEQDPTKVVDEESTIQKNEAKDPSENRLLKALLIKFSLSPGSYATMFLRELTKESTEFDHQTNLMNN